MLFVLSVWNY
jgi:hypothetical protein